MTGFTWIKVLKHLKPLELALWKKWNICQFPADFCIQRCAQKPFVIWGLICNNFDRFHSNWSLKKHLKSLGLGGKKRNISVNSQTIFAFEVRSKALNYSLICKIFNMFHLLPGPGLANDWTRPQTVYFCPSSMSIMRLLL